MLFYFLLVVHILFHFLALQFIDLCFLQQLFSLFCFYQLLSIFDISIHIIILFSNQIYHVFHISSMMQIFYLSCAQIATFLQAYIFLRQLMHCQTTKSTQTATTPPAMRTPLLLFNACLLKYISTKLAFVQILSLYILSLQIHRQMW